MLYLPCLIYPPGLLCSDCSSTQELEQEAWVCSSSAIRVPPDGQSAAHLGSLSLKRCFPEQPCSVTLVHKQGSRGMWVLAALDKHHRCQPVCSMWFLTSSGLLPVLGAERQPHTIQDRLQADIGIPAIPLLGLRPFSCRYWVFL